MRTIMTPALLIAVLAVAGTGCAMRVTGVVHDAATGTPMGGAVVTADDGRERLATTDPLGRFNVKTDCHPTNLTVSAPGYQTTTVAVSGNERFPPPVSVDLQPTAYAAPRAALVKPIDAPAGSVPAAGRTDDGAAAKFQQLQDLHDRGLISDEEYRRTRSRIVDGL